MNIMDEDIEELDVKVLSEKELSNWENPPKVMDLKQDYIEAQGNHDAQIAKINTWLDNLNVTGSAKVSTANGRSQLVS